MDSRMPIAMPSLCFFVITVLIHQLLLGVDDSRVVEGVILCRQQEREALLDLQKAAQDLQTPSLLSHHQKELVQYYWFKWDAQEEECCHWQGVVCHPVSGRVTQLRLPTPCSGSFESRILQAVYCSHECGRLPASLSRLESLEVLDVRGGCFSGVSNSQHTFSPLTNLSHLDLSSNPFHSLPDLPLLPHLTYLNFSNLFHAVAMSSFHGWGPQSYQGFDLSKLVGSVPKLEYFDLANTYLQGAIIPAQIGSLQHLVYLDLSAAYFEDPGLPAWRSLANLSHLSHLGLDSVTWPPAASVQWQCNWKALESLWASNIRFASKISPPFCLDHPAVVTKLKHLSFGNVQGSIGPLVRSLSLANASLSLKTLSLPGSSLWEFEAEAHSQRPAWLHALHMPFLEVLDLSLNQLTGIPFWLLDDLPLLHSLDMSQNSLSRFPPGLELLPSLKSLDISSNLLQGPLHRLLPANLSQMWESLTLSHNEITGALPLFLLRPSLMYLDVSENQLSSVLPALSLADLSSLSYLDLSRNFLRGEIPLAIGNLSRLAHLDLSHNSLGGHIPLSIGSLSRLAHLDLSSNSLGGHILPSILGSLSRLAHLDLSYNSLGGHIPRSIGSLSRLAYLDLSFNSLGGHIPLSIGNMSKLVFLRLSGNHLSGTIPLSIGNLSSLTQLDLSENSITGIIPASVFQDNLVSLDVSGNQLTGSLPYSLQNWVLLSELRVSNNFLSGSVAEAFDAFQNCPFLSFLDLSNNTFSGNLSPTSLHTCKQFGELDMSKNQIWGEIPREIGNCSNLWSLDLSENNLSGGMPRELGNIWGLVFLYLSSNNLSGAIPVEIGNLSALQELALSNNHLSFEIPASLGKIQSLYALELHNNKFNGGLPSALQNCSSLQYLDLSNNELSGAIPEWITGEHFPGLVVLMLSNNHFRSSTPVLVSLVQNFTQLQILGLANNLLSGSIPSNVNRLQAMTAAVPSAEDITLSGTFSVPDGLAIPVKGVTELLGEEIVSLVIALDFSSNRLEGEIPAEIGALKGLYSLNLSHNLLNGSIPRTLGELGGSLESLDLSNNNLTGDIPPELCSKKFSSLEALNLSHNRLQGAISQSCTQLCTFNASSYAGNDGLLYECEAPPITQENHTLPQSAPSYPLHRTLVAKLQERVSLAGWGIGHILGFLFTGLFLHHRARISK